MVSKCAAGALAISYLSFCAAVYVDSSQFDVSFDSPTAFDGKNYADGMPAGNGRTVVLAWANATNGGMDFYIRSPLAQHTDSQLYTIGKVAVSVAPNPFATGAYFNQSLHLATGSVEVLAGGSDFSDYSIAINLWVDANSDAVIVTASSRDGVTPFNLSVTLSTVRPATRFNYTLDYQCAGSTSSPDVVVSAQLPNPAPAGSIALYHVNSVAAGDYPFFNSTMFAQGLGSLASSGQFIDPLDGRIFGCGIAGGAGIDGSGPALVRAGGSASSLVSQAPATAFALQVAVLTDVNAHGNEANWLSALATNLAGIPAPAARFDAHVAWWSSFWNRSYILTPPSPPPMAQVGVFTCGGSNAAAQVMVVNATTGELRLPGGTCLTPSSDGTTVFAGPCTGAGIWIVTPCNATGCTTGDQWVLNTATGLALGLPGAICPWTDVWTVDNPTGQLKNELWSWNATDSTVRALCTNCPGQCLTAVAPSGPSASGVSAQYARTRFVQAVQSRGHNVPIKFNGMLFTNQAGTNGPNDVDYRQWGPDHWWQNTRLPYGSMLAAGDLDSLAVALDWISSMIPLVSARTAALLPSNQSGIFFTETMDAFGLFQGYEYGCAASDRPAGYPVWLEAPGDLGGWVRYDYGGNGAGPESGLMGVDYYWRTLNATAAAPYVEIAKQTLAWYMSHYPNRTSDGNLMLWPTQVLETYWCEWPGWVNCCQNDMPQVAAITALTRRLLQLPDESGLVTPAERASYTDFQSILPPLPTQPDGQTYAPAAVVSSGSHNSEVPELFAAHPFRLLTVGRSVIDPTVNLTVGRATWQALPLAKTNTGWYYGGMDAALLGLANESWAMVQDRASQPPPPGYRFPAFAQHYQDYEPSADHYANMMTALQMMVLQSGEDEPVGTIVLLPAWPCDLPVSFKLWGPLATSVEVEYDGNGTVTMMDVQPPSRAAAVKFAACVTQ